MVSKRMTSRLKAAAVAALMCVSMTAVVAVPAMMTNTMDAYAASVSIGKKLAEDDVYKGFTADIAESGIKTITFTVEADYTGNFSFGLGLSTDKSPEYWTEYDGKSFVAPDEGKGTSVAVTKGEKVDITVDVSKVSLKYADPYNSKYDGTFEFRNYYSGTGSVTLVSVEANASASSDPDPTEPEVGDLSEKLGVKDVFTGYWADYAKSGIKNVAITFTADFTGTVNFGMGIGVEKDPYWYEWDADKETWIDTEGGDIEAAGFSADVEEGKSYTVVYDTSKYDLSYNPKTDKYPGHFEFRNNYVSETGGTITVTDVQANSTAKSTVVKSESGTTPGSNTHEKSKTDGWKSANKTSGFWEFTDNKDGTGTMTATQARQIEFEKPYVLTRGYDEEYYLKEGTKFTEGTDPINSHKFNYSTFGLSGIGTTVTLESLTATITCDRDVDTFMYGGGLNVVSESPADTEAAKSAAGLSVDENAGYWYNDMGEDKLAEYEKGGAEFGIDPGCGYYLSAADGPLGKYFNVIWDVPEDVQPYATSGDISFQYWYGVEASTDADVEYEELEIDTVNLAGGVLTYTEERTFDYTDSVSYKVGKEIEAGDMSGEIGFADAGVPVGDGSESNVHAVVFHLTTTQDLDKLVYAVGASVGEKDFKMWSDTENGDQWNFVLTNQAKGKVDVVWMVPDNTDLNEEYGNIQFGYWYGGKGETEMGSITLDSVDLYFDTKVTATEPETTEPETDPATDPELKVTVYGDVDCNGKVTILDVIALNKNLMVNEAISAQGRVNADVDLNKKVDEVDSLNILKCVVELTDLPV